MNRSSRFLTTVTALSVLAVGAGCADSQAAAVPAVCESFADVQNTVGHIRQANVSENGLTALRPYVSELIEQLRQLALDAQAQFGQQADHLRAAVGELSSSVDTAREKPDRMALAAVRNEIDGVRTAAQSLATSLRETC
jgi:hypothetical protein